MALLFNVRSFVLDTGGITVPKLFMGTDKRLVKELRDALLAVTRRDSQVNVRPTRSRRSGTPIVDPTNAVQTAGATALLQRCNDLLAMARPHP